MPTGNPGYRRFSVSLEREDYERLKELARSHKPPLTMQYLIRYAVYRLLKEQESGQLRLDLER